VIKKITEQAYWAPLHTYVTTYGTPNSSTSAVPGRTARFYLAKVEWGG